MGGGSSGGPRGGWSHLSGFLLLQVDLSTIGRWGTGLGNMKTCLVPGLALCLLLGPLAGEGLPVLLCCPV